MQKLERKIHQIDARGMAVGRIATRIATILRGKHKPEYLPHLDQGDIVHVENIKELKFSGKKLEQKNYKRYSGYPGGIKTVLMKNLHKTDPADILRRAVREMLPPTKLRPAMLKRLIIE